jgi:hypothetical protein
MHLDARCSLDAGEAAHRKPGQHPSAHTRHAAYDTAELKPMPPSNAHTLCPLTNSSGRSRSRLSFIQGMSVPTVHLSAAGRSSSWVLTPPKRSSKPPLWQKSTLVVHAARVHVALILEAPTHFTTTALWLTCTSVPSAGAFPDSGRLGAGSSNQSALPRRSNASKAVPALSCRLTLPRRSKNWLLHSLGLWLVCWLAAGLAFHHELCIRENVSSTPRKGPIAKEIVQ